MPLLIILYVTASGRLKPDIVTEVSVSEILLTVIGEMYVGMGVVSEDDGTVSSEAGMVVSSVFSLVSADSSAIVIVSFVSEGYCSSSAKAPTDKAENDIAIASRVDTALFRARPLNNLFVMIKSS
jgi:hypothetical protein